MKNLLNIYNEYFNVNYNKEEMNLALKNMKNKKEFYNNLIMYLDRYIIDSFDELKRIECEIPKNILKKYNYIKKFPILNKVMLNHKIKKYEELSQELLHYIDETRMKKYYHKLIELKQQTNDQRILELIHEEIMNLNKIKNELYYRFDHFIIEVDLKKIERKIKDSNNKKIINFPINYNVNSNKTINKPNRLIVNKNVEDKKYDMYLKKPLLYFDIVKYDIITNKFNEEFELEMLNYIDDLKKEFIYMCHHSINPNNKEEIIKIFERLDNLVYKKINYNKQYVKKAS